MPTEITLPHNYEPRSYQLPLLKALDMGVKRAVAVWHRRCGKDKTCLNWTIKQMVLRKGVYFHLFPTYSQGKKALWDGIDGTGMNYLDHFPKELVASKNETELQVVLRNGSVWQIIGTDNINRLMGSNPVGLVFSEYALQDPGAWDLLRPILAENGGWAIFIFTPRGENHAAELFRMARANDDWFCQVLTVDETIRDVPGEKDYGERVITAEDIDKERAEGMPEEKIQQEYYCSFEGSTEGYYYRKELALAEQENRITKVPWNPALPVDTAWDLGVGDSNAIWFYQCTGMEVRVINYYENTGFGLPHYVKVLGEQPYVYGKHYAPHDIEVREYGSGITRKDQAKALGIKFTVAKKLPVDEGIAAVRMFFPRMWFDKVKCQKGIRALLNYKKDYDEKDKVFANKPYHDWASHGADAKRTFAVCYKTPRNAKPFPQSELSDPTIGY